MIAAKSASISPEMVPISRCMALCRTVTGLRGHSASDHGDRYALGALYARQDTRILLRNGQHPIPRHRPLHSFFFFFLFFFPPFVYVISFFLYSLSLALPIPFVRLSPSSRSIIIETVSRSHPAAMHTHVCCSGYVWLVIPHDSRPDLTNQRASISRVKVTLV